MTDPRKIRASTMNRETEISERKTAIRALLREPLFFESSDQTRFACVVRHKKYLTHFFRDRCGWKVNIDSSAGFARLLKYPQGADPTHPLRGSSSKSPFDRRRYVMLCLTISSLEGSFKQTTLSQLAELLKEETQCAEGIDPFDPERTSDRRAFVDVLTLLLDLKILSLRDGDAEKYNRSSSSDALFDVNEKVLAQLIATEIPASLALSPADLDIHRGEDFYTKTRRKIYRILLDQPILYHKDLDEGELAILAQIRSELYRTLENEVGLSIERRIEGVAAIDFSSSGEVSDELFPHGGSTVKHAALLLSDQLREKAKAAPSQEIVIDYKEIVTIMGSLIKTYGETFHWRKELVKGGKSAPDRLTRDSLSLLERFRLIEIITSTEGTMGIRPLPGIARFSPKSYSTGGEQ